MVRNIVDITSYYHLSGTSYLGCKNHAIYPYVSIVTFLIEGVSAELIIYFHS